MPTARQRRTYPLLELDPELGRLVPPDRQEAAERELRVELYRLPQGEWHADRSTVAAGAHVGLLLVDGVVSREVVVADCVSTELLGPGDILRPWAFDDQEHLLRHAVRWNALTDSRVAILDRHFATRLGDWPEVNAELIDRVSERARRLAATQAISQLTRVERRLAALFWHLAERWGRVTPQGIVVPLTLSHRMLAQLIGARRPTVSTSLAKLDESGAVTRRPDGTWLLTGEPAGVAAGEAVRIIEERRRPPRAEPPPDLPGRAETAESAALATTSLEELTVTLGRLRLEADSGVAALREASEHTQALLERMGELRAEHQRWLDERARARA